ncbi:hypothetical protein [Streptomyces odonnellii]|uniref:hypothetical protein n=1 Tax=Streptomyces odonnellii TaxID=1417980 RepID=UPI001E4688F5|nr:hypothetical protein [Streptomyces odonnellii]
MRTLRSRRSGSTTTYGGYSMFRTRFRTRATGCASLAIAGVLLLSACNGDDTAAGSAAPAGGSAASADATGFAFKSGTAQQNNADLNEGDLAANAAPAKAAAERKPVVRKWVQLSAGKAGELDPVVINGAGFTLYRFDKDTADPSVSNCSGECATTWPPYLVAPGGRVFIDGVDKSAIGFIQRDGAFQVTIGGWPVYLFSKDTKPGDTNGQGVGGTWFGVTPDGQKAGQNGGGGTGGNGASTYGGTSDRIASRVAFIGRPAPSKPVDGGEDRATGMAESPDYLG